MGKCDPVLSRRDLTAAAGGIAIGLLTPGLMRTGMAQAQGGLLARAIPHGGGETLPAVGIGSAIVFDVGSDQNARARLTEVVRTLVAGGGKLIDTAPSYGTAENVIGDILAATALRPKVFLSTKLEYDVVRRTLAVIVRDGLRHDIDHRPTLCDRVYNPSVTTRGPEWVATPGADALDRQHVLLRFG